MNIKQLAGVFTFLFFLIFYNVGMSQTIDGEWYGVLSIQGGKLRLMFDVKPSDGGAITAVMYSIDQGNAAIPVEKSEFVDSTVTFSIPKIGMSYSGKLVAVDSLSGEFRQGAVRAALSLRRGKKEVVKRPQDPVEPYPYLSEDVTFENARAGVTLAGTLTLPSSQKPVAAVVMVSGSGAQNRNSEILNHRPFLVWADYLTRHGIAVLRYDDRGVAGSTGDFAAATTYDFADDAQVAVAYLRSRGDVDPSRVGIIGHSEGGAVAQIVASRDSVLRFIVMLAAPGIPGDSILILQNDILGRSMGLSDEALASARHVNRTIYNMVKAGVQRVQIANYLAIAGMEQGEAAQVAAQVTSPWMVEFLKYDPAVFLRGVRCDVLALNGMLDKQVPYVENLSAIEGALLAGGNERFSAEAFPFINHLFQGCVSGDVSEYVEIEESVAPVVLKWVGDWIKGVE